jgi:hypothetical protein
MPPLGESRKGKEKRRKCEKKIKKEERKQEN